ncbi:MAG TPA: alkene reductase [Gammaproteobacteria bacterium]|nr:alkene reductase [Gammaproteobacteria bacterium]
MAPMTRCFAADGLVPAAAAQSYYAARADAGLIVTEATLVDPRAQGYPRTPGIYTDAQLHAWRAVTDAVHVAGGRIFCQLWHTGRLAHSHYTGCWPLAPSAVAMEGPVPRAAGLVYEQPRALQVDEIRALVMCFAQAARNAMEAGFDGVELHAANGYLVDQFLHQHTNRREDEYGGSPQGRVRFALELIDSLLEAVGEYRAAIRLSPQAYINLEYRPGDEATFDVLLQQLNQRPLAYVHLAAFDASLEYDYLGGRPLDYVRTRFDGSLIACGGYDPGAAEAELRAGRADLVAFGRSFIANPDLVARAWSGRELVPYEESMLQQLCPGRS